MKKPLVLLFFTAALLLPGWAPAEEETKSRNFQWLQFNLYKGFDNKNPFDQQDDTYIEMEFGGRSGFLDFYGFFDVFDIFDSQDSDFHNTDNLFLKTFPRFSINHIAQKDLSWGPVQEWYLATLLIVGDRALFEECIGLGVDFKAPWDGKLGANLMARYVRENYGAVNEHTWDGYFLAVNWFAPFYHFANESFLSYQGYLDFIFSADEIGQEPGRTSSSVAWYNGFYWHQTDYSLGYGLKYYKDYGQFVDGGIAGETSGFGHYVVLGYKF